MWALWAIRIDVNGEITIKGREIASLMVQNKLGFEVEEEEITIRGRVIASLMVQS